MRVEDHCRLERDARGAALVEGGSTVGKVTAGPRRPEVSVRRIGAIDDGDYYVSDDERVEGEGEDAESEGSGGEDD